MKGLACRESVAVPAGKSEASECKQIRPDFTVCGPQTGHRLSSFIRWNALYCNGKLTDRPGCDLLGTVEMLHGKRWDKRMAKMAKIQ